MLKDNMKFKGGQVMEDLEVLRKKIDSIDKEIVELFEERMGVVLKVAEYKEKHALPILNAGREQEVIRKNLDKLKNKNYVNEAEELFKTLMEVSRKKQAELLSRESEEEKPSVSENSKSAVSALEKLQYKLVEHKSIDNVSVGYYGEPGSFSNQAQIDYFGESAKAISLTEFEDVFIALKEDKIKYGVVPVENSSTGGISEVQDLLRKYGFFIVGEKCVKISQHLLGVKGAKLEDIEEVYSHPQGFKQSNIFFREHPSWQLIPYYSTSLSAKMVSDKNNKALAAVASEEAAELYNLNILKKNINYNSNNYTKFVIIGKELEVSAASNKISILIAIPHKVGSLYNILRYFSENNLNMMKIESRPIAEKPWEYFFYIDFEGNIKETSVGEDLKVINANSSYFKILGNYIADTSATLVKKEGVQGE